MDTEKKTLSKQERINGTKRIDLLFSTGDSFIAYPLRIVYTKRAKGDTGVSVMVSVSKKKFKRAVKRNRVKRLVREAFRLNKASFRNLSQQYEAGLDIAFLFLKNELPDFKEIESAMLKTAALLENKLRNCLNLL
ncbi:ribonuclease P protein component [Viscerimonas tarda]